jgi:isopentenyldiphosphate isomerase
MSELKRVVVVDENDEFVKYEEFFAAKEQKVIRRAARVFVFNESGKLLLQKRSQHVLHPGLLDQSVGGHVDEGETYHEAAVREMKEELGLSGVPLVEVVTSYRTRLHHNGIYTAVVADGCEINFDSHEVETVRWVTTKELDLLLETELDLFTESFPQVWRELRDKIIPS